MRPLLEGIFDELVARHGGGGPGSAHIHLNDIAEAIGDRSVTYDEVEALVDRLEGRGFRVGEPLDADDIAVMRAVLACARRLRVELGRKPTVDEVARASAQPAHAVRRALEHAARAGAQSAPG